jgi:hypothetical protein
MVGAFCTILAASLNAHISSQINPLFARSSNSFAIAFASISLTSAIVTPPFIAVFQISVPATGRAFLVPSDFFPVATIAIANLNGICSVGLIYHHHDVFDGQICGMASSSKCYNMPLQTVGINQPQFIYHRHLSYSSTLILHLVQPAWM